MEKHWKTFVYVFLTYIVQDAISPLFRFVTLHYHGLTHLKWASFSQRYLAKAQDNINVLLKQMKMVN